jgi:small subunit ribosomal protein S9
MTRTILTSGKRKTAIARAVVKPGKGRILLNRVPIELYQPELTKMKLMEPLVLAGDELRNSVDIKIRVQGGGFMSRAEAARTAIARGLVAWSESEELRRRMADYDRSMLVGDFRRKEPKKAGAKGARAKYQKSYR